MIRRLRQGRDVKRVVYLNYVVTAVLLIMHCCTNLLQKAINLINRYY